MIFHAGCATVFFAVRLFLAAQPSHSDDFSNAPEPISLDTGGFTLSRYR